MILSSKKLVLLMTDKDLLVLVNFRNLPIDLRQISYKSVGRARDFLQLSTGKLKSAVESSQALKL